MLKCALTGAAAGLAGAFLMHRFRSQWNALARPSDQVFGLDNEADVNSVRRIWEVAGWGAIPDERALRVALGLHYLFGAASGAAYGVISDKFPALRACRGLVFGATLWSLGGEWGIAAAGFSDPRSKSAASHWGALLAHLLFGLTTDVGMEYLGVGAEGR